MNNKNPLLQPFAHHRGATPFDAIKNEHFLPALNSAIEEARKEIEILKAVEQPNFENTIIGLERSGQLLAQVSAIFFNLNSAETNDEMQKIAGTFSSKLSAFSNELNTDAQLFEQIKKVKEGSDIGSMDQEDRTLLEKTFKRFTRNGALLDQKQKKELKTIDQQLAELKVKFGQNLLNDSNNYALTIEQEEDLEGLPDSIRNQAAETAQAKGLSNKWVFTLDFPSYVPFMTYSANRALRQELFLAYGKRGAQENEYNNSAIAKQIAELRLKRANLLGYNSHAAYTLEERMAALPDNVQSFLNDLLDQSLLKAKEQVNEVSVFAVENGAELPLQRWDFSFWSEKLKQKKYSLDDELLKPYFSLEKSIEGVFTTANKLYGLTFKPVDIPAYHPDVKTYEVFDDQQQFVSLFYADFFPRPGKRNGAWMTSYKGQWKDAGKDNRPHVSIVCNFSKPSSDTPSLLTFQEVRTLFHEFGHALHGMLANGKYESLSGTNVYWDFVELPSQIFENWLYEKECLDLFAKHFETNEAIPESLVASIKNSASFLEGYQTVRQLSFGLLDMAWHNAQQLTELDLNKIESTVAQRTDLFPPVEGTQTSTAFAHIFSGGYSAGYYSYKWAEVLDADAFERFKEEGLFNRKTADDFKRNILEKGGSEHPAELFARFRKRPPNSKALLKRAGLLADN